MLGNAGRDIFYKDVDLFKKQSVVDEVGIRICIGQVWSMLMTVAKSWLTLW